MCVSFTNLFNSQRNLWFILRKTPKIPFLPFLGQQCLTFPSFAMKISTELQQNFSEKLWNSTSLLWIRFSWPLSIDFSISKKIMIFLGFYTNFSRIFSLIIQTGSQKRRQKLYYANIMYIIPEPHPHKRLHKWSHRY